MYQYFIYSFILVCSALNVFENTFAAVGEIEDALRALRVAINSNSYSFKAVKVGGEYKLSAMTRSRLSDLLAIKDGKIFDGLISIVDVPNVQLKIRIPELSWDEINWYKTQFDVLLEQLVDKTSNYPVKIGKKTFRLLSASASLLKEGRGLFIEEKYFDFVSKYFSEGKLSPNKMLVARGFLTTNGTPSSINIDWENTAVVETTAIKIASSYNKYTKSGDIMFVENGEYDVAIDDGSMLVLNSIEPEIVRTVADGKGLVIGIRNGRRHFAKIMIPKNHISDIYGSEWSSIPSTIATSKFLKSYKGFKSSFEIAEKAKYFETYTVSKPHIKKGVTWYAQALQFLYGATDEELRELLDDSISAAKTMNTIDGIKNAVGEEWRLLIDQDSRYASHAFSIKKANDAYIKRRRKMAASIDIVDNEGYQGIIAPDTKLALSAFVAKMEGVELSDLGKIENLSLLREGELFAHDIPEGEYWVNRAPSTGPASWVKLRRVSEKELDKRDKEWSDYLCSDSVIYVNCVDLTGNNLQWDFDGDKIKLTSNKAFDKILSRRDKNYGTVAVVSDSVPGVKESLATARVNAVRNNKVGIMSDVAFDISSTAEPDIAMAMKADVAIRNAVDSAKLAALGGVAKDIRAKVRDHKRPWALQFAERNAEITGEPGDGILDRIAKIVFEELPENLDFSEIVDNFTPTAEEIIDLAQHVMNDAYDNVRIIPGLLRDPKWVNGAQVDDGGLINQIAKKDSSFWSDWKKASAKDVSMSEVKLLRQYKKDSEILAITEFSGKNIGEVADYLAKRVFSVREWHKAGYVDKITQIVGDIWVKNFGIDVVEYVDTEWEEDWEGEI